MLYSTFRFCCVDFEECFDVWLASTAGEYFDICRKKVLVVLCIILLRFSKYISIRFNL